MHFSIITLFYTTNSLLFIRRISNKMTSTANTNTWKEVDISTISTIPLNYPEEFKAFCVENELVPPKLTTGNGKHYPPCWQIRVVIGHVNHVMRL